MVIGQIYCIFSEHHGWPAIFRGNCVKIARLCVMSVRRTGFEINLKAWLSF